MAAPLWRFGACAFDEMRRELRVGGAAVDVEAKPLDLLHQLLLHAGEVVTKDELLESVWPGTTVVDQSLATAVSKLRKALGDEGLVVTVPRVGYRLGVPVQRASPDPPAWTDLQLAPGAPVPRREQWRLVRRLDVSLSSEVWIAEHPKTRETRVFKFAPDTSRLRGLKREVTLSRLLRESLGDRPDFVRILEWSFDAAPYFTESEYAGPTLDEWAAARGGLGAVPLALRVRLVADVARAVAAAHGLDVLHKDLKPSNILVSTRPDGTPQIRVADFGSATLLSPSRLGALGITSLGFTTTGEESDSGGLAGTMRYLAPEVLAGQSPSARSDVYALGILLYQMVVGDVRRPLAAGWEADVADPLLREDIAEAASGDPAKRFQSATALGNRLSSLETRRAERAAIEEAEVHRRRDAARAAAARARRPWVALAAALVIATAVGVVLSRRTPAAPALRTVAVLPLRNLDANVATDHLRLALADEAATILSHVPGVAVRPFASMSGFAQPPLDLSKFGRDIGVEHVLTGHFSERVGRLAVTLEAIDTRTGALVWRDSFDAPAAGLMSAQVQLALRIRGGLARALGVEPPGAAATEPTNEAAYTLFLRSTAMGTDPGPNREALGLLEDAVRLDPAYAPVWQALSKRLYIEARYGNGNRALIARGETAAERAVSLDPDYVAPAAAVVIGLAERGELATAQTRALDLVRRRPDSVDTQFALSYVYRYAGLLDDAARHCEAGFLLDPRNRTSGLRSCAVVFLHRGDYARATNYLHLDEGSEFERALSLHMYVRQGREDEARRVIGSRVPAWGSWGLLGACVQRKPADAVAAMAAAIPVDPDAESNYFTATHLAYCGLPEAAARLLARTIDGGYCAYPVMDADPLLASLRATPAYTALRASGRACQERFVTGVGQAGR